MVKAEERFDVYDREMNWQGTATRTEVHAQGLWHQTFHCWIVQVRDNIPYLLFQRRHPMKDTYPNLLDISCAGHLEAGETVEDGLRELREELGLLIAFEQLHSCGTYVEDCTLPKGVWDREFCHTYWLVHDLSLMEYEVQADEVIGLYWVKLSDLRAVLNKEIVEFHADGIDYTYTMGKQIRAYTLYAEEIVPHPVEYYEMLLRSLESLTTN